MGKLKHGEATRINGHTKLYNVWREMRRRCSDRNRHTYRNYMGRGIRVCEEWINDFSAFKNWAIEHGYRNNLCIDRINNRGHYEPNNCRFVTYRTNNTNTRRFRGGVTRDGKKFRVKISFEKNASILGHLQIAMKLRKFTGWLLCLPNAVKDQ